MQHGLSIHTSGPVPTRSDTASSTESTKSPPPPHAEMAPVSRETRPMIVGGDEPEAPYPIHLEGSVTHGFGRGARFLGIPTANLPDSSLGPLNELGLTGIFFGFARVHPSLDTPLPTALPSAYPQSAHPGLPSGPSDRQKPIRHLSDLTASSNSSLLKTSHTNRSNNKDKALDESTISSIPAHTAPYPANSSPGMDGDEKRRLMAEDGKVWPMVMSVGYNPYFKNEKVTAEVHIIHPFQNDFYAHDMTVLVLGYVRPELDYVSKEALISDINTDVKVALKSLARPQWAKYANHPYLHASPGESQGFNA